jgi:1-deoxy-D-xylulose-5-phosphate reductoisomerase
LLGSTGSIGVNSLNIAREFGLSVEVLSANRNISLLNEQIKEFKPKIVVIFDEKLKDEVAHKRVYIGKEGIKRAISEAKSEVVVNAIVGYAGLDSTLIALNEGKRLALANKESLVTAGAFIDTTNITPIDSEHFGLWYLLQDKSVKKMLITASGGAFRDSDIKTLASKSAKEALNHPNWLMGKKITIDSATMTNKLFELLEARWLFGEGEYDAVIETKSLIHALIEFVDGSMTAHLAYADMRLPIAYALLGRVERPITKSIDLVKVKSLEFREIDEDRYPVWRIKDELLENPKLGVVVNAANEIAVEAFLNAKIGFLDISEITTKAFYEFKGERIEDISKVYELDVSVREFAKGMIDRCK